MAGIKRCHIAMELKTEERENQQVTKKLKIVGEDGKVSRRGSMLRARYADFIAKYSGGAKAKTTQELLLEKQQRRQEERKAARLALEKLEQSVRVDDNYGVIREMELLTGCSISPLGYAF